MCKYISQILLLVFILFIVHSQIYNVTDIITSVILWYSDNCRVFKMSLQVFLNLQTYWYVTSFQTIRRTLFPGSFCMKFFCLLWWSKPMLKCPLMQTGGIRWLSHDLCLDGEKVAQVSTLDVHFHSDYGFIENKFFSRI